MGNSLFAEMAGNDRNHCDFKTITLRFMTWNFSEIVASPIMAELSMNKNLLRKVDCLDIVWEQRAEICYCYSCL